MGRKKRRKREGLKSCDVARSGEGEGVVSVLQPIGALCFCAILVWYSGRHHISRYLFRLPIAAKTRQLESDPNHYVLTNQSNNQHTDKPGSSNNPNRSRNPEKPNNPNVSRSSLKQSNYNLNLSNDKQERVKTCKDTLASRISALNSSSSSSSFSSSSSSASSLFSIMQKGVRCFCNQEVLDKFRYFNISTCVCTRLYTHRSLFILT